ncbi:MAG: HEAT repeat domain-containing protein [Anaerolineae bacterium]|nr:HEAT repeat domain-containing protein [Anaerolineae bacterium]
MPDSNLAGLLAQLKHDNPNIRVKACRTLGKRGYPESIPHLVRVYERFGEDEKVREAAKKALERFVNKMPSKPGASRRWLSAATARRLVIGLSGLLVVLLLLNVMLRLGGEEDNGENVEAEVIVPTATPSTPTPRDELLATYETLYQNMQANFAAMRIEWGTGTVGNLLCTTQLQPMESRPLAEIDRITYPDFDVALDLEIARAKLAVIVERWLLQCSKAEGQRGTLDDFNKSNDGLNTVEPDLQALGLTLAEVRNNPAPTIGPTVTLTSLPTDTVPAPTATPVITETPAPPAATATLTPTITLTPEPTIDPNVFNEIIRQLDLGLAASQRLNENYWFRIRDGQRLDFGCTFGVDMPKAYEVAPALVVQHPEVGQAVQLLNDGVDLLEQSFTSFSTSCQSGNYSGVIDTGIANATQAYLNFEQAKTLLTGQ